MPRKKSLKCVKCKRTFNMPAHYARHMAAMHGVGGRKKTKFAKVGRPAARRGPGRPKGSVNRSGSASLRSMGLEDLLVLISDAKRLAKTRLLELSAAIR
jgi:uncharacterized C2H2 Zn-finger protein